MPRQSARQRSRSATAVSAGSVGWGATTAGPGAPASSGVLVSARCTRPTVDSNSDDVGYAVGAGVDYLVTPNLSLGLEYLYTDLGKTDTKVTYTNGITRASFNADSSSDLDFHTVWAKASFRFN